MSGFSWWGNDSDSDDDDWDDDGPFRGRNARYADDDLGETRQPERKRRKKEETWDDSWQDPTQGRIV